MTPLQGPKLLASTFSSNPTVDVHNALTPTLGLPISGKLTSWAEGTGGFLIAEGGDSKWIFLDTVRHVVFKPDRKDNKMISATQRSRTSSNLFKSRLEERHS